MLHLVHRIILHPLRKFLQDSRSIGITLLSCTAISLFFANWGYWSEMYQNWWTVSFDGSSGHHGVVGFLVLPNSPAVIINDGLMALFFFLVGMEIKRELVDGELASLKRSLLPIFGAIGGMVVPAVLFSLFAKGTGYMSGWAIPTATDIAFTLGVASLLGKRVPVGLKIFITALAIIDDLGAIVVIAFFYGDSLHLVYLLGCLIVVVILLLLNHKKIRFGWLHCLLGIVLWYCMFNSGIHATIAGVIFAMLVPAPLLSKFELRLHPYVYFIIMPLFALANTAIGFPDAGLGALSGRLGLGIIAGLCIGKPLGICAACYLLVSKNWTVLPNGVNWNKMIGAGLLSGIGFTMSLFITNLAFGAGDEGDIARISVLLASGISMLVGFFWLAGLGKSRR